MITIGSKKRLYTGSWILAALLLVGYNGFALVALFNPSLAGHSVEIKLASKKWRQFQETSSLAAKNAMDFDLDLILSKVIPGFQEQEEKVSRPQAVGGQNTIDIKLPVLSGIIRFSDIHGDKRLLAVIEGRAYPEKAEVQDYIIKEITQKGVVLTKSGTSWFVPAPEVYFSLDRSGLAGQARAGTINAEKLSERPE